MFLLLLFLFVVVVVVIVYQFTLMVPLRVLNHFEEQVEHSRNNLLIVWQPSDLPSYILLLLFNRLLGHLMTQLRVLKPFWKASCRWKGLQITCPIIITCYPGHGSWQVKQKKNIEFQIMPFITTFIFKQLNKIPVESVISVTPGLILCQKSILFCPVLFYLPSNEDLELGSEVMWIPQRGDKQ